MGACLRGDLLCVENVALHSDLELQKLELRKIDLSDPKGSLLFFEFSHMCILRIGIQNVVSFRLSVCRSIALLGERDR